MSLVNKDEDSPDLSMKNSLKSYSVYTRYVLSIIKWCFSNYDQGYTQTQD